MLAQGALEQDLDLVALATIADVVPLVGENRTLVRRGLRALASTAKPGLRALMAVARVDPAKVDERAVAFALAPRLNAAGRLYRADAGLELILTEDPLRAAQIAEELDRANRERRQVEMGIRFQAEAQMAELGERAAYVLAGEGWHPGVIGIVASRLVERSGRPVVLIALDGDKGRASGRSVEAFDLLAGLTRVRRAPAALRRASRGRGPRDRARSACGEFANALATTPSASCAPEDLVAVERVDAVVGGEELGMALAEELRALAPFGRGNPPVSLMVADATFADVRPMGEGKHARFTVAVARRARAGGRVRQRRAAAELEDGRAGCRRRSRWRSTSGTASASRAWCCARRRPRERARVESPAGAGVERGRARPITPIWSPRGSGRRYRGAGAVRSS